MIKQDYDRYSILRNNDGTYDMMPYVKIPNYPGDKYEYWNLGVSRLEKIANKYYGNPFYDFIILYANPEYVSAYDIPDNALIRIPFPLKRAKRDYENELERIKNE